MKDFFGGGKSIAGMVIVAAGAIANYLGYPDIGKLIAGLGASLFGIGLAHKVEKIKKNK